MRTEKMSSTKRSIVTNIILISGICLFVILAIYFPQYYDSIYDNRLENTVTYEDSELMVYETGYDSFYDKLCAIALCRNEGITLNALQVNEYEPGITDDELSDVIQKEIDDCFNNNILVTKIKVSKDKLISRELNTLYATNGEKKFNNIKFYKLKYRLKDCYLTLYLDSEFYRIYDIELVMADSTKSVEKYIGEDKACNDNICMVGGAGDNNYYDIYNSNTIAAYATDVSFYKRNEAMLSYLGLDNCTWDYSYDLVTDSKSKVAEKNKNGYSIDVELGEKSKIDITQYDWTDADQTEHWEMGVGIKEYLY